MRTQVEQGAAHRESVGADIADIAGFLQENLGQNLVAHLSGISDRKLVGQWARREHKPRPASEAALRATYQVFKLLEAQDSPHVVRAWFIGINPQLQGESPIAEISEGHFREVYMAANAFAAGG